MSDVLKPMPPLLSIKETALILKASEKTVHRLIKDSKLPVIRYGRVVRIAQTDLDRFIAAHRFG